MDEQDPFLIVKSQVEDNLSNATNLFESWKRIQQTVSSPKNQELLWTADELNSTLEAIEQDLDDLHEALHISQANPSQFNLTSNDLNSRRQFLDKSRNLIQSIRYTLANPPAKNKLSNNQSIETVRQNENSRFIESEQMQQSLVIQEQDQHLDAMGGTLINLKEIAGTMNREIDDHVIILDDLGERVDRSEGRLKAAMRRVTDILRKEEGNLLFLVCTVMLI
ncbi:hypothetical protein G6F47_002331 [Rhizopus delemar]|uniref:t-SNARE coiled-coil homology domain-containing protein n=1 Tax=Rhizopus delemar TaxID=936053 RepID=A0A9P7CRC4_9FUNG|nr:hypothetical protein G6F54_003802 [Rhizopus delemar]KAG1637560.1 hypothetical protein G6F45_000451 [Rhizopus arrhizus]KAG1527432.1 hypothetical protein G6F52_001541 [Rhizopus delemar]KAG1563332.1 hypothetical protein G6F49_000109 [Rhizopus delemar]KAG1571427.1 hypothetical protein G6F50_004625 [Rhizopus delemar]